MGGGDTYSDGSFLTELISITGPVIEISSQHLILDMQNALVKSMYCVKEYVIKKLVNFEPRYIGQGKFGRSRRQDPQ
jgi:hypothetical protein